MFYIYQVRQFLQKVHRFRIFQAIFRSILVCVSDRSISYKQRFHNRRSFRINVNTILLNIACIEICIQGTISIAVKSEFFSCFHKFIPCPNLVCRRFRHPCFFKKILIIKYCIGLQGKQKRINCFIIIIRISRIQ